MTTSVAYDLDFELDALAKELFEDVRIRSVGIGDDHGQDAFIAIRNSAVIVPQGTRGVEPTEFNRKPVLYIDTPGEVEAFFQVPVVRPYASNIVEQQMERPVCIGLEIQNFDNDSRNGTLDQGLVTVGTLGCFVKYDDKIGLLSNNHVIAGENDGRIGTDRILQQSNGTFDPQLHIGNLSKAQNLSVSPWGATMASGNVMWNEIDAAVADLISDGSSRISYSQGYHPQRNISTMITSARAPKKGDKVLKVGRTTGYTEGIVKQDRTVVGPIQYKPGPCWFRRSFVVEGINGHKFSDRGDSGSAIVTSNGELLGILYAGNGQQTYCCPIDNIFSAFSILLA